MAIQPLALITGVSRETGRKKLSGNYHFQGLCKGKNPVGKNKCYGYGAGHYQRPGCIGPGARY